MMNIPTATTRARSYLLWSPIFPTVPCDERLVVPGAHTDGHTALGWAGGALDHGEPGDPTALTPDVVVCVDVPAGPALGVESTHAGGEAQVQVLVTVGRGGIPTTGPAQEIHAGVVDDGDLGALLHVRPVRDLGQVMAESYRAPVG